MNRSDLMLRIRALFQRNRVEQELDEELQFHLEMAARKHGSAARRRFGSLDRVKEECRTVRGTQLIETSLRDVQYALRGFRRNPLFVLTVVGTIALGLGLNVALFTVFNNYVLRPLSVRDPYGLYSFTWTNRAGIGHDFSWREFEQFRSSNRAFSDVVATHFLFSRSEGRPMMGELVTGNYFQMLDVGAAIGRVLLPEDAAVPGKEAVAVLSYASWQSKFAGRPDILGRKLYLHGYPLTVIGVVRQGFGGLGDTMLDYWAPLTMAPLVEPGDDLFGPKDPGLLRITGRLRRGWSVSQAKAVLTTWSKQQSEILPEAERATGVLLESRATPVRLTPEVILTFSPLMAAFGLVLVLACANVANMMLARAMARQREIGIRLSLGAGRGRLIRQLLTESVLLAVPAGLAAFVISRVAIDSGIRLMFATLPSDMAEQIPSVTLPADIRVFLFVLVAALASAILFGLAPALQSTRPDVMQAARGEFTSDARPMRLRNALVIGQITVCVLLLICSAVLIRGAREVRSMDVGFRKNGVIVLESSPHGQSQILSRLTANPAVEAFATASSGPLNGILPGVTISVGAGTIDGWYNFVSPEFFSVLAIPMLEGRNFTEAEGWESAPVAIISELAAGRLWPNGDAVGKEIRLRVPNGVSSVALAQHPKVRIVGVARNIISCSIPYGPDPPVVYLPSAKLSQSTFILTVRGNVERVRRALVTDFDATSPGALEEIHPMDQNLALNLYPFRVASWVGSTLGGLALLLTLSGIYGVLSYLITQRTKEIGIRMALGATTGAVARMTLMQSGRLALIGICIGSALALGVSRLMASHLVFINTFDALAYGGGIVLVATAALAAAYIPSRRAARIDPVTTLRYD